MVADALSRLGTIESGTTSEGHHRVKLFQELEQAYKRDLETNDLMKNIDAHLEFCTLQNKLYYKGKRRMQLYLPQGEYRDLILQESHDARFAGNLGVKKTTELTQRDFYLPTLQQDVVQYVHTCEECQCNKPPNQRKAGLL